MNKYEDANRILWNELTDVHVMSYGVDKFKAGQTTLDEIQLREMGDLKGKTLLHLQCHFGLDTLSLAREGAIVTGVDFTENGVETARRLSLETGIPARFICANVLELDKHLDEDFDVVYTSQGALNWISDIGQWARIISRFLKPGGMFYVMETHPIANIFEDTKKGPLEIIHSYFRGDEPKMWDDNAPDYSDPTYHWSKPSYEWQWAISDIVNAIIAAGLEVELLNEYDKIFSKTLPDMERDAEGWWVMPSLRSKLPLMFTLRAKKK